jgi:dihydroorotase
MKLLIKDGKVIDPGLGITKKANVLVEDGKILEIPVSGKGPSDAEVIDAKGCWVVPGLIDIHVHLREPGEEYKETIETGASAAIAGGITAVACMANTKPTNDSASVTEYIIEKAKLAMKARVYPVGAATKGLGSEGLAEIGELIDHGCVAISNDGRPVMDASLMRHTLEYCKGLEVNLLDHSEDLDLSKGGVMNEGDISTELGLHGIPAAAEESHVSRNILLAELADTSIHFQHVSTKGSIRLIREAKARGLKVTCETCPHYFTLTDKDVRGYDTSFKMNPPLRSESDRQAVIEGLIDGTIDAIASDHAPHSPVEKDVEFDQAANGIVGLETLLPLSLNLVKDKHISPSRWVELLSINPAKIIGVEGGRLEIGKTADITVLNPDEKWTIDRNKFISKGRNTPFHGMEVKGRAKAVIVGGRLFIN